jgi:hypothetical protein
VPQKRALAAPASSHDNKDVPPIDREVEIPHNHETPVGHGEILDRNMGICILHFSAFISTNRIKDKSESLNSKQI